MLELIITLLFNPSSIVGYILGALMYKFSSLKAFGYSVGTFVVLSVFSVFALISQNSPDYLILPIIAVPFTVVITVFFTVRLVRDKFFCEVHMVNHVICRKIPCPCCGNYTVIDDGSIPIVDICPVCSWKYDETGQENPDRIIGPNHITLNMAKENYKKYGACSQDYLQYVRKPTKEEFPENNK